MIKLFCDKCGLDLTDVDRYPINENGVKLDLCYDCYQIVLPRVQALGATISEQIDTLLTDVTKDAVPMIAVKQVEEIK